MHWSLLQLDNHVLIVFTKSDGAKSVHSGPVLLGTQAQQHLKPNVNDKADKAQNVNNILV